MLTVSLDVGLELITEDGPTRMVVSGELDLSSVGAFATALTSELQAARDVLVDLTAARFGDATPLGALTRARTMAEELGRRLTVVPDQPLLGL